ncbi:MAG: pyridoxal phosphate-dependent aminotransferase [Clostridiales bacterium]|nr:pyridoxal phosphate-dependent aminotransferase [Clostridiales bacterium]
MFSKKTIKSLEKSSWIRAMFEEGNKLRQLHGADNIFDFSLGNPDVEPPKAVKDALFEISKSNEKGMHKYMSNGGYESTRKAVADMISKEYAMDISLSNICMVTGAAAGINVTLKSLLNDNEEVIIFKPFFAEYLFYITHANGIPVIVDTIEDTFTIDLDKFTKAITKNTKAIIINSPNNPTGVVYSESDLIQMATIVKEKEREFGTNIFIVSDEPYTKIVFGNVKVPVMMKIFKKTISVNSYSKSLSLPGERIGYITVSPLIPNNQLLMSAILFNNRTLGFVNAPAIQQRIIEKCINEKIDPIIYEERRDLLYNHLISLGFTCQKPDGAFYLFMKSPEENEVNFVKQAQKFNILLVPGRGFGQPGYVRLSYCISKDIIKRSLPSFTKLAELYK